MPSVHGLELQQSLLIQAISRCVHDLPHCEVRILLQSNQLCKYTSKYCTATPLQAADRPRHHFRNPEVQRIRQNMLLIR